MAADPKFKNGPLSDLRVIEMGTLLAGPFCGQLLGDMGAEVIKIEPPGQGDPLRVWGRQKAGEPSLWWPVVARNKKAITLDMRQAEGQKILKDLVKNADFLLENFRPGTMEKWGCGCPVRDVFTMVYEPKTSPLRVRLCVDPEADRCEALCNMNLEWNLEGPLKEAGATDVKFVE